MIEAHVKTSRLHPAHALQLDTVRRLVEAKLLALSFRVPHGGRECPRSAAESWTLSFFSDGSLSVAMVEVAQSWACWGFGDGAGGIPQSRDAESCEPNRDGISILILSLHFSISDMVRQNLTGLFCLSWYRDQLGDMVKSMVNEDGRSQCAWVAREGIKITTSHNRSVLLANKWRRRPHDCIS